MDQNRPRSRDKNITGQSNVSRRGSGIGGGPVGSGNGYFNQSSGSGSSGSPKRSNGRLNIPTIIIVILILIFGGKSGLSSILSPGTDISTPNNNNTYTNPISQSQSANNSVLNTSVAAGSRDKYTSILGNKQDKVTIMVYMCGTDLESKYGMATSDMKEMMAASLNDNINILVYTGGCKGWKNNIVSSSVNQIYKLTNNNMTCLVDNAGSDSMTKPETLTSFINYCTSNYPANRQMLIFWDHGGGSVSGYGYDEKHSNSGSMDLSEINSAIKSANTKFDFIGFDACLMATLENALMLSPYADYLIASEETEPGVGWYYTNWLSEFSKNTSMPTIEIGKKIVDDFIDVCNQQCYGQKTTLSVVDLAELSNTVPAKFEDFANSTSNMIANNDYKTVSNARYQTREFAQSSSIDQIDLVHFATNIDSDAGTNLAIAIVNAVKYNRTSSNMTNAYGLSIYFPYKKTRNVDNAVSTYHAIGLDDSYCRCIKSFAKVEVSGQAVSGGNTNPYSNLTGSYTSSGVASSDAVSQIIGSLLSSNTLSSLTGGYSDFFSDRELPDETITSYVSNNQFDSSKLVFIREDGSYKIKLTENQWDLVTDVAANMFFDDGMGYIDLGLDNTFSFDDTGNLVADMDNSWLAVNGQPVAYYYMDTVENGDKYCISGYIPALLNGERVNLLVIFDNDHPNGYIVGARTVYTSETDAIAKETTGLNNGDKIDFLCDFYSYSGKYEDSYMLGKQLIVSGELNISNVVLTGGKPILAYRFTDIYNQTYWTDLLRN